MFVATLYATAPYVCVLDGTRRELAKVATSAAADRRTRGTEGERREYSTFGYSVGEDSLILASSWARTGRRRLVKVAPGGDPLQ